MAPADSTRAAGHARRAWLAVGLASDSLANRCAGECRTGGRRPVATPIEAVLARTSLELPRVYGAPNFRVTSWPAVSIQPSNNAPIRRRSS